MGPCGINALLGMGTTTTTTSTPTSLSFVNCYNTIVVLHNSFLFIKSPFRYNLLIKQKMKISLGCITLLVFFSTSYFLIVQTQDNVDVVLCGGIPRPKQKKLICPAGSYIVGDSTLVCHQDGQWRAAGTCVSNRPNDFIRPCR